jgi:hypothetical protein
MRRFLIIVVLLILTSCSMPSKTQTPTLPVDDAVATMLAGIKANTPVVVSTLAPVPTATLFDLRGLYCEYQFCIGHPQDMAFYDVNAQQNVGSPSTYSAGILASYNTNLFIQVMWQISPGASDPTFLLNLILNQQTDASAGNQEIKLVGDMNVIYTPITSTASPNLAYGGAAAWTCGDRVFAWKVYTPDQTSAAGLFDEALKRFTCNK